MNRRILRIITALIIIQSLLFFPSPISRAQDVPAQARLTLAKETADLFMKRLDETGDFSSVIDEMYVEDFMDRYLRQQILEGKESAPSSSVYFGPGIEYRRDLLKLATKEDLRNFYIAFNNLIYQFMITGLNKHADDLLNGREWGDEWMDEKVIPPNAIALLNKQPALKGFFRHDTGKPGESDPSGRSQSDAAEQERWPKPIETLEELQSVTETLQEALRLLIKEHGDHLPRMTERGKSALEVVRLKKNGVMEPMMEITDKEFLGLSPGTRIFKAPTPFLFLLIVAEVNGKQKIIWAEFYVPPSHI
jgi:hypothetical protein